VLEWLRRDQGGAEMLRSLLDAGQPLTHQTLDELEPTSGLILDRRLAKLPQQLIKVYAQWRLLRRARDRFTVNSAHAARTRVLTATTDPESPLSRAWSRSGTATRP